ncbi:MAG: hypothetical protein H6616_01195 [Ignavibacteria bacterium]|nr:hypothetical protein [Ignavibacteria bacterium]
MKLYTLVLLFLLFVVSLHTQPSENWKLIDLQLTEAPTFNLLLFADSSRGYGGEQGEFYRFGRPNGRTTDGGNSWLLTGIPNALPLQFFGKTGYTQRGQVSRDNSLTWEPVTPTFSDTAISLYWGSPGAGGIGGRYVRIYDTFQDFEHDSLDRIESFRANRLIWTTDGETWEFGDTTALLSYVPFRVGFSVKPGFDPYPSGTTWGFVIGWEDTNTFLVLQFGNGEWLGRYDVAADTSEWIELPAMWKNGVQIRFPDYPFIELLPNKMLVALSPISQTRNDFWTSIDGGYNWRKWELPDWLDTQTLRFFDSLNAIGSNGKTRDGGKTWERFGNSWWTYPVQVLGSSITSYGFFPIDTTHLTIGRNTIFARSDDGGKTWQRNRPATTLYAFIAREGLAVMSRDGRMILRSEDNGNTWEDVGRESGLPEYVRRVGSLAFADRVSEPDKLFGLAEFSTYNSEQYIAFLQSTDGGANWSEGERLPELGTDVVGTSLVVNGSSGGRTLYVASDSGILASENDGVEWSKRTDRSIEQLLMADRDKGIGTKTIRSRSYPSVRFTRTSNGWNSLEEFLPLSDTVRSMAGLALVEQGTLRGCVVTSDSLHYLITSEDGGGTWEDEVIEWFPYGEYHWLDTQRVYVFSEKEGTLYYSGDGGRTYHLIHDFTGEDNITFTRSTYDSDYLYFAGNGTWLGRRKLTADSLSTVRTLGLSSGTLSILGITGEESSLVLRYHVSRPSTLTIALYDRLGREVIRRSGIEAYSTGLQQFKLETAGLYFIRVSNDRGEEIVQPVYRK